MSTIDTRQAIFVLSNVIQIESFYTTRKAIYKKGTPKAFRRCEIVTIILRRLVRVNESSKEYY